MSRLFRLSPLLIALLVGCAEEKPAGDSVDPGTLDEDADGSLAADDCDDTVAEVFPGAEELCNNRDDDCDGYADEEAVDQVTVYADLDSDGAGDAADPLTTCDVPAGYVETADDCDDTDAAIGPSVAEVCDDADVDEDCSGAADDLDSGVDLTTASTWYADADADGYGDLQASISACDVSDGYLADASDCDDLDAAINPAATEICDEADADEDCDDLADDDDEADEETATTWYLDNDGDGFGDADLDLAACDLPDGYVADATDCDDDEAAVNPDATEACDDADVDEDCDGGADNDDPGASGESAWYADADADGFGDAATPASACDQPDAYVSDATDCDDTSPAVYPAAPEFCDGQANDCDTSATWTADLEAGTASWADATGAWTEVTDTLVAGTSDAPVAWTASADGELTLCDGTWYAQIDASSADVVVTGLNGSASTILDAGGTGKVVATTGGTLTLSGVTLQNGSASSGAGLYCLASDLVVDDVVITGNTATSSGGGVLLQACTNATLTDVRIEDNLASAAGGLYATSSSGLVLEGLEVTGNVVTSAGGGLSFSHSDFTLIDSTISENEAGGSYAGGGVLISSSTGTLDGVTVSDNVANTAAGLLASGSTVDLVDCVVSTNLAGQYGAALYADSSSTVTATGTTFDQNLSGGEAPIYLSNSTSATFDTCTFTANEGTDAGVFAFSATASASIVACDFSGNTPNDALAAGTAYTFGLAATVDCDDVGGCL